MYIIICPDCGNQDVKEVECGEFECSCGEDFSISRADYEED